MDESAQKAVCGGGALAIPAETLTKLFNFSSLDPSGKGDATAGFNSPLGQNIATELELMASTPLGMDIMQKLISTGKSIDLTDTDPKGQGSSVPGYFYYENGDVSKPAIDFKGLIGNLSYIQTEIDFNTVAHEVYHAYEHVYLNMLDNPKTVGFELDANLAAAFIEKQLDAKATGNNFYEYGAQMYVYSPSGQAQTNFYNAWYSLVDQQNFTINNYNELIATFKQSKYNSPGISNPNDPNAGYNNLTATPLGAGVDGSPLYGLFQKDVFYPVTPPPSGYSYGSYNNSDPYNPADEYSWNLSGGTLLPNTSSSSTPSRVYNETNGHWMDIPPGASVPTGYTIVDPSSDLYQHLTDPTKPYFPPNDNLKSIYQDPDAQYDDDKEEDVYGYWDVADQEDEDDNYDGGSPVSSYSPYGDPDYNDSGESYYSY